MSKNGERREVKGEGRRLLGGLGALLIVLWWLMPVGAQGGTAVETLSIEIWPDYDQPSVLALLTGELTAGTALPATITIPLPANAQVNAVARITPDGVMTDDIDFTETADSVTLTTPDPSFRVEYYYPYTVAADEHSFVFNWTANLAVNQMSVLVQQPASAASMTTNPAATAVSTRQLDGLTYHALPVASVPTGQTYSASVSYQMTSPLLTVARLQNSGGAETAVSPPSTVIPETTPNWALYLTAVGTTLIGIAMFWQAYNNRQKKDKRPASRKRPAKAGLAKAGFCHNCGQRRQQGDQFCRHCGTALK